MKISRKLRNPGRARLWVLAAAALGAAILLPRGAAAFTEQVLYSFSGGADGARPGGGLIMDALGNLYGTTGGGGGFNGGVVFELAPDGAETVLYSFCQQAGCADGVIPQAGLIMDAAGNLYGTTRDGGTGGFSAMGTVFILGPDGTQTVLYSFCSQPDCVDGRTPVAGLIVDAAGNLYGTTTFGGDTGCFSGEGCGGSSG